MKTEKQYAALKTTAPVFRDGIMSRPGSLDEVTSSRTWTRPEEVPLRDQEIVVEVLSLNKAEGWASVRFNKTHLPGQTGTTDVPAYWLCSSKA